MGELDELVSTLLGTFTTGIRLLKASRKRHRSGNEAIDTYKDEETPLIKSFKRSRSDIREAWKKDSIMAGPKFSEGDARACSSLSTILSRLNTAFTSAIVSFSRGKVKSSDREALIKLSNESRVEAINTLNELSKRLSVSASSLTSRDALTQTKNGRRKREQNLAPTVPTKPTALGPATKDGWIRPKSSKKGAAKSKTHAGKASVTESKGEQKPVPSQSVDVVRKREPVSMRRTATENRKSGFSFASDSTKLGEIPEHRLARLLATSEHNNTGYYMHTVAYPLAPYQPEPHKRRFGIGKLFKSRPAQKDTYSN
ncbi:c438dd1b-0e90-48fa-bc24-5483a91e4449 [Sclerotinia trifoliorum]|uniref:C438dd1b-0e90-48fa-bc24-5483a91e4449 n=1 Tax=Sclerotinia trifoliorum TaxID=28548 RepID=A0A8H2W6W9_9HELO|nr:c438dd1b-0e90-48fa-bc24-5483a91e4449 [Sclerotinia trifoliorum]